MRDRQRRHLWKPCTVAFFADENGGKKFSRVSIESGAGVGDAVNKSVWRRLDDDDDTGDHCRRSGGGGGVAGGPEWSGEEDDEGATQPTKPNGSWAGLPALSRKMGWLVCVNGPCCYILGFWSGYSFYLGQLSTSHYIESSSTNIKINV